MNQYLVEVTPGRELLYQTRLAFRAAMRSGEITADSRIFHRTTSTWVSITEHPEYRHFLTEAGPLPWFHPSATTQSEIPLELVVVRWRRRGLSTRLAELGATLMRERAIAESYAYHRATSGWTAIRQRFSADGAKTASSPQTATPAKRAASPKNPTPPKPAKTALPALPPTPRVSSDAAAQAPGGTRNRWTFYP